MNEKEKAIKGLKQLEEHRRSSVEVEFARKVAENFGCVLHKGIIRGKGVKGVRELVFNPDDNRESVVMDKLAFSIVKQKKLQDKCDFSLSNQLMGVGSSMSAYVGECARVLSEHYDIEFESDGYR